MDYNFSITARDFTAKGDKYRDDAPHTSSGQVYDLLAVAGGFDEYNELDGFGVTDPAIEYVLTEYDWERAYIETLNAASKEYEKLADLTGSDAGSPTLADHFKRAEADGLLFGAWYALNAADMFAQSLKEWKGDVRDNAREYWDDPAGVPADLLKELRKAADSAEDDMMREYLEGDYGGRNWNGVYREAGKALFGERDMFHANDDDRKANRVNVTISQEEGTALAEEYDGVETGRPAGVARVKAAITARIRSRARVNVEKERADRKRRADEYAEQRKRREEREQQEETERRAKLLAMTR